MSIQRNVQQWVDYIQTLHFRNIDMSLDRVAIVLDRMLADKIPFTVISVAGTNGKGSTSELLSSVYCAANFKVGKYTSPHLVDFNERIEVNGEAVNDACLLDAFERVEQARGEITLTYFEFATLVCIAVFCEQKVDIAVMEVGLGGRLDAVNVLDADLAIITNISIDHTAWLGSTVEQIAREKAGVARADRACVIGTEHAPQSLLEACRDVGATLSQLGIDFSRADTSDNTWDFANSRISLPNLPLPFGQSGVQLDNAAAAVQAVDLMRHSFAVSDQSVRDGIATANIRGRCQIVQTEPMIVLDVAHNAASVIRLNEFLNRHPKSGRVVAVCGMLRDKEIRQSLSTLVDRVHEWHFATISGERGSTSHEMQTHVRELRSDSVIETQCHLSAVEAYRSALETLTGDDCLLVFGSFFIVGDILRELKSA